jgi:hypothetical protein
MAAHSAKMMIDLRFIFPSVLGGGPSTTFSPAIGYTPLVLPVRKPRVAKRVQWGAPWQVPGDCE